MRNLRSTENDLPIHVTFRHGYRCIDHLQPSLIIAPESRHSSQPQYRDLQIHHYLIARSTIYRRSAPPLSVGRCPAAMPCQGELNRGLLQSSLSSLSEAQACWAAAQMRVLLTSWLRYEKFSGPAADLRHP